jgi:hypothetical protein
MEQKLKVRAGYKEEDEILIPVYKSIPIEEEFIKFYPIMKRAITLIGKVELLLMLFLCERLDEKGLVSSNSIMRDRFVEEVKQLSKGDIIYNDQTIKQAFTNLKKLGMLVAYEGKRGFYYFNTAFLHIGEKSERRTILKAIEEQENGTTEEIQNRVLQGT